MKGSSFEVRDGDGSQLKGKKVWKAEAAGDRATESLFQDVRGLSTV